MIYTKGDEAQDMYTVVQGEVLLYDNDRYGSKPESKVVSNGTFGEKALQSLEPRL